MLTNLSNKFEGRDLGLLIVEAGFAKVSFSKTHAAKNIDELRTAEAAAKEAKLGLWTTDSSQTEASIRRIQWLSNDGAAASAFATLHKGAKLPAVVEFIRDAGCYRVYFTKEFVHATILLSGIRADGFRRIEGTDAVQPEPFALEAKFFASTRVLNRDLEVRIEGADEFGNILGTFVHPNGNLSALLLRNGFARLHDKTLARTENPSALRDAQKEAQQNRIRKWRAYDPQTIDEDICEYMAKVIEVSSGDCITVVKLKDNKESEEEHRLYLASIRCPRPATRSRPADPWSFEAKELVRKKLIGKKVKIVVAYTKIPGATPTNGMSLPSSDSAGKMYFVSVTYDHGKSNIAEDLMSQGLATIVPDRSDDPVASNYDVLLAKGKEAAEKKLGIHSSEVPKHRVNDLSGMSNATMAKSFEESLKRANKLDGIIEYVNNGSRFKIRIPSESLMISFSLAGIRSPSTARHLPGQAALTPCEDFGDEALHYSRVHYLQRSVVIKIETCDRGGTFIGLAWIGKECINVQLAANGLAEVHGRGATTISAQLEAAQKDAAEKRLGLWSMKSFENGTSHDTEYVQAESLAPLNQVIPAVSVVHSNAVDDLYIQPTPTPEVDALQQSLADYMESRPSGLAATASSGFSEAILPKKGECVLAKFSEDNQWYRARVEKTDAKKFNALVCYIDFGNTETLSVSRLRRCPPEFSSSKLPALSRRCMLAGLKPPIEMEAEGADALAQLTDGIIYRCVIENIDPVTRKSIIQLFPLKSDDTVTHVTLNETLVLNGLALVDGKAKTDIPE